jgi:methylenetetrahydrofolate reductase (NADPH)
MKLQNIYQNNELVISFEVFPPRTEQGIALLIEELQKLLKYQPGFISVTYGAGGMSQDRSLLTLERIVREIKTSIVAHLTCIGSSRDTILGFIRKIESWGIENILALRGDYPKNNPAYKPESNFFKHAVDLIYFTKQNSALDIGIAGFPEKHPEASSQAKDLDFLKQKIDAGAAVILSQLFFQNEYFLRYRDAAVKAGINVPIIPGIMPLLSVNQIPKILECGATIPAELRQRLEDNALNDKAMKAIGEAWAILQIEGLLAAGVPGIHLYPLNKASSVTTILDTVLRKRL